MNKFLLLFSIFIFKNFSLFGISIVYFHGGNCEIPNYAIISIKQALFYNHDIDIHLIINNQSKSKVESWNLPENCKIHVIRPFDYSNETKRFLRNKKNCKTWFLDWICFERFFHVRDLIRRLKIDNVVYLETDNLIYCDLKKIESVFENYDIGIPYISDEMGICGIAFFKNHLALSTLCSYVEREWNLVDKDMVFWAFLKKMKPDLVRDLPVLPPECDDALINQNHCFFHPHKYFDLFKSVFDPAPHGQFLGGFFCGSPGDVNPYSSFSTKYIEYIWKFDETGKRAPYIKDKKNNLYKINNLHIHSKKLELFKSY